MNMIHYAVPLSGGGAALNFEVVGGTTQPTNPKENTIWVNTDMEITDWAFSADEPIEAAEGMVWIQTGIVATAPFNALKKNAVTVYPLLVRQYISDAWVRVVANTYQNGTWVEWLSYIYNRGNEYTNITGGWVISSHGTKQSTTLEITLSGSNQSLNKANCTANAIDLTPYSRIEFEVEAVTRGSTSRCFLYVGVATTSADGYGAYQKNLAAVTSVTTTGRVSVDVSALTGEYHIVQAATLYTESNSYKAACSISEVQLIA